nr:DUF5064 family protein [uncultured Pseudomonas sp.]
MFEPGHLHIARPALQPDDVGYDIHIHYEAAQTDSGPGMHFTMEGEINGKSFNEAFDLPKDLAYNFASEASRIAEKHGLPRNTEMRAAHAEYDLMFEDIREKLDMKSGDPVKPEHLE